MTAPARLLHITDCHLLPESGSRLLGVDTAGTLAAVLAQALGEFRADAILATGDLGHEGTLATYRRFIDLVRARFDGPLLCVPGNHDAGAPFAAVLGRARSLTLGGWQVLGFDTHEDDRPGAWSGASVPPRAGTCCWPATIRRCRWGAPGSTKTAFRTAGTC